MSPPPPSTAASSASTGGTKKKKKKKNKGSKKGLVLHGGGGGGGAGGITIRPFARPPSLPANFYEASVTTLERALGCVLREEPLYVDAGAGADAEARGGKAAAGGGGGGGRPPGPCASPKSAAADPVPMDLDGDHDGDKAAAAAAAAGPAHSGSRQRQRRQRRPVSREELYGLVEDLVTHNYGPQLYGAVLAAVDEAAGTCLRRMVGVAPGCVEVDRGGATKAKRAVLFVPGGAAASSSATAGGAPAASTSTSTATAGIPTGADGASATTSDAILAHIHAVCASYYEYLRCVRSVFLHLDRRFVYIPGGGAGGGDWKR